MSNEIFDINNVKQEFLQNMGPEYVKVFSEKQLEMSVYMLNEFCDALIGNGLVLTRNEPEVIRPAYRAPPTPQMGIPPQYQNQGYQMPVQQPQYQQPPQFQQQQYQDPFQEQQFIQQQVQQQVKELNAQLPRTNRPPMDAAGLPPVQEVELNAEKPKSFADKIREMRAGTKKPNRINPDDND